MKVDLGLLWIRIFMGTGIAYHGFGKISGGTMDQLASGVEGLGFPAPLVFAWLAALAEFAGGIAVVIGLQTRMAAFFIFITMSVAAFLMHAKDPFTTKELALAYWAFAGMLMLTGGGKYSIDGHTGKA